MEAYASRFFNNVDLKLSVTDLLNKNAELELITISFFLVKQD